MSRGGTIRLIRMQEELRRKRLAEGSGKLVREGMKELGGACRDVNSFFVESAHMLFAGPLEETMRAYESEIARKGATSIAIPDQYIKQFVMLQTTNLRLAAEKDVKLPSLLEDKPVLVTNDALIIQKKLSTLLKGEYSSQQSGDLAKQMQDSIEKTQGAYDKLCVVAGMHTKDPSHPVFESAQKLFDGIDATTQKQIGSWIEESRSQLQTETKTSWSMVALGAAKKAVDMSGFMLTEKDLAKGVITAHEREDFTKKITVKVSPETGELSYDMEGYKGRSCEAVEKRFLSNLEIVIGAYIPESARVSRPKLEQYGTTVKKESTVQKKAKEIEDGQRGRTRE